MEHADTRAPADGVGLVLVLGDAGWAKSLKKLRNEGFYNLPWELELEGGGRWLKNAIVQLGYNRRGRGILFVGERHDNKEENVLLFSDRGMVIEDKLLEALIWAPILPVREQPSQETPPYLN